MLFWLGTHRPNWLEQLTIPMMVSHRILGTRKRLPRARGRWVLDSGGFTELNLHGRWTVGEDEYVESVDRYSTEIGLLEWAAPQDWMCEPFVVEKTGLSVDAHQHRTVDNFCTLKDRGPFIPVLQGWAVDDYWNHVQMYLAAGIDLRDYEVVGLGSVCRRAATSEIVQLVDDLTSYGLRLHGFGMKREALKHLGQHLASADSMAWSYNARRSEPLPGCVGHKSCSNCQRWALRWREETLRQVDEQPLRLQLWGAG